MRCGSVLIGAVLLACAAHAEDGATKGHQAFVAICSAAIDEKPDIAAIATSLGMENSGGFKDAIAIGRTGFRGFTSSQLKQGIIITITTYSDAREIECRSNSQVPSSRAEFESLAQSLMLEGDFFPVPLPGLIAGRWKRHGSQPLVFITMTSGASFTTLNMQRIDVTTSAPDKK
jgi:hypothetical protein